MMFNLFGARRNSEVEIARDADQLIERMERCVASNQRALDALGERHGDVDFELLGRIETLLEPLLGPSGIEESRWFQSADYYGNGIRHLEFKPDVFPIPAIPSLQALLTGDHACFGILCWTPLGDEALEHTEGLVVFASRLLMTRKLARIASGVGHAT